MSNIYMYKYTVLPNWWTGWSELTVGSTSRRSLAFPNSLINQPKWSTASATCTFSNVREAETQGSPLLCVSCGDRDIKDKELFVETMFLGWNLNPFPVTVFSLSSSTAWWWTRPSCSLTASACPTNGPWGTWCPSTSNASSRTTVGK